MKSRILLAAAMSLVAFAAVAADLPVKARKDVAPNPFVYPLTTSGPYAYFGTEAGAGSANVTVPGLNSNSITTTSAEVHIGVGYVWAMPNGAFAAVQASGGWQNFNGDTPGFSFSGPLAFQQEFMFGIPMAQLMQVLPFNIFGNLTPPPFTPPTGITVNSTMAAFGFVVDERDISLNFGDVANKDWAIAPGLKLHNMNMLSNGLMADIYGKVRFDSLGACVGSTLLGSSACAKLGTSYLAGVDFKFGI